MSNKNENRITPELITKLYPNEIFTFGSNLLGLHGAGAARLALDNGWAPYGQAYGVSFKRGEGTIGAYAIPTKGLDIETLPLPWIRYYVNHFIRYASNSPQLTFLTTEVGCGLAGYTVNQIAPLFSEAIVLPNVHLPKRFWDLLKPKENVSVYEPTKTKSSN